MARAWSLRANAVGVLFLLFTVFGGCSHATGKRQLLTDIAAQVDPRQTALLSEREGQGAAVSPRTRVCAQL